MSGSELSDVQLARRATEGDRSALQLMEARVFVPVRDRLAHRYDHARADEALQHVREQLLVQTPGLSAYAGQGSLRAWVMVIAARRLLATPVSMGDALDEDLPLDDGDLDVALLRARFAGPFKRALAGAVASLDRRERLLLRMSTLDGLSAQKIGAVFHVHRATATGWIVSARTTLRERVLERVKEESGVSTEELQSIARAVHQLTDLSLPRLLAQNVEP